MSADTVPAPPAFFELNGEYIGADSHGGQHSWHVRGQNFVTVVTWAGAHQVLSGPASLEDEHMVLVFEDGAAEVAHESGAQVKATGPAVVIVPAGKADVTALTAGYVLRVFTSLGEVAAKAVNASTYAQPNPMVAHLPDVPEIPSGSLRVIPLADVQEVPGRLGRIYRTASLMINWFAPQDEPRNPDELSPHVHDDFEQASVTLAGDYVHHVRRPWTKRIRDWRPDEHVQVMSPSVTLIPPGNIHTSRGVGRGPHQLIDVFAPPRTDFIERGWVLNQADYETLGKEELR